MIFVGIERTNLTFRSDVEFYAHGPRNTWVTSLCSLHNNSFALAGSLVLFVSTFLFFLQLNRNRPTKQRRSSTSIDHSVRLSRRFGNCSPSPILTLWAWLKQTFFQCPWHPKRTATTSQPKPIPTFCNWRNQTIYIYICIRERRKTAMPKETARRSKKSGATKIMGRMAPSRRGRSAKP